MTKIGQHLVKQEMVKLPSLKKDIFFTQKFKKILDHFIDSYNFPDFVKVHFEEDSPFKVSGWITVEFEPAMKYDGDFKNVNDLTKIKGLSIDKANIIALYLDF